MKEVSSSVYDSEFSVKYSVVTGYAGSCFRFLCTVSCVIVWLQAGKKVGLSDGEAESFVKNINDVAVKEKLKQTTQEAIDLGVRELTAVWYLLLL